MNIRVYQGDKHMKNMSKAVSLILCASFMMSICSCEAMQRKPKETEDLTKPVVDLADDLGRYIVNMDYGSTPPNARPSPACATTGWRPL